MLRNYLIIAWRNLLRHRLSSAVNVTSLSLATAYALLALTYVHQELTYDAFHVKADRIYRVCARYPEMSGFSGGCEVQPDLGLGPALVSWHPSVARAVRIRKELMRVGHSAEASDEWTPVVFADPEILEVFDFPLMAGNASQVLAAQNSVVLTQSAARRYFPDRNPLGQVLQVFVRRYEFSGFHRYSYEPHHFTITGVLRDPPANSSITFDLLLPYQAVQALNINAYGIRGLFVELTPGTRAEDLEAELPQFAAEYWSKSPLRPVLSLQPLRSIHFDERTQYDVLGSNRSGRPSHLYILSGMALLVAIVAALAYANLGMAQTISRVKEVGVRKTVGATRRQLLVQFWGEAVIMSFVALVIGIALAEVAAGPFGALVDRRLETFGRHLNDLPWAVALTLATGLISGAYPALVLSRVAPAATVRGTPLPSGRRSFSRAMMVLQFSLSTFLLVCVAVMGAQFLYLQTKDLGFDGDHVLAVDLLNNENPDLVRVFREELGNASGVLAVAGADQCPGLSYWGATWLHNEDEVFFNGFVVEPEFRYAMGLRFVAGRWLDPAMDTPSGAVVANEAFVRRLGWSNPVGRKLEGLGPGPSGLGGLGLEEPVVVGVVQDFHYRGTQRVIEPALLRLQSGAAGYKFLIVRLDPERMPAGLAAVQQVWRRVAGNAPFIHYFLGEYLDTHNKDTERWTRLVRWTSALTLLIAGLSVFGLAALEARRRTKEIGIRKVLGASVPSIVALLSKEFTYLVLAANVIAWPVAYFAMHRWLENFAYRIELGVGVFVLGGVLALLIAWLTVSYQAIRAARANPVEALRYE